MKSIRIKDLEIVEQERQQAELPQKNLVQALADLAVENRKKDTLIQTLSKTIATQNIEIVKLKGAGTGV